MGRPVHQGPGDRTRRAPQRRPNKQRAASGGPPSLVDQTTCLLAHRSSIATPPAESGQGSRISSRAGNQEHQAPRNSKPAHPGTANDTPSTRESRELFLTNKRHLLCVWVSGVYAPPVGPATPTPALAPPLAWGERLAGLTSRLVAGLGPGVEPGPGPWTDERARPRRAEGSIR